MIDDVSWSLPNSRTIDVCVTNQQACTAIVERIKAECEWYTWTKMHRRYVRVRPTYKSEPFAQVRQLKSLKNKSSFLFTCVFFASGAQDIFKFKIWTQLSKDCVLRMLEPGQTYRAEYCSRPYKVMQGFHFVIDTFQFQSSFVIPLNFKSNL